MTEDQNPSVWDRLAAVLPPKQVHQRPGPGGKQFSYIKAQRAQELLDTHLGPASWESSYRVLDPSVPVIECTITVRMADGDTCSKADVGYPEGTDEPYKDAYSDAFKRACVQWGLFRYAYLEDEDGPLVEKAKRAVSQAHQDKETPSAPSQSVSEASDEPPHPADTGEPREYAPNPDQGSSPELPFEEPSEGSYTAQNRWGDPIPEGVECPDHGTEYIKVEKKSGDPYLNRKKQRVAHCFKSFDTDKKPWEGGMCWGEFPLPA